MLLLQLILTLVSALTPSAAHLNGPSNIRGRYFDAVDARLPMHR